MLTTHNTNIVNVLRGDIFNSAVKLANAGNNGCSVILPHVCNNIDLFGAGFAAAVAKNYPIVKENFHLLGNQAALGHVQFISVYKDRTHAHEIIFANMIAQNGVVGGNNRRPLNYLALVKCMTTISAYLKNNFDHDHRAQIHAPKFGSGLAGGNWKFIQELITDIWHHQTVFIYEK